MLVSKTMHKQVTVRMQGKAAMLAAEGASDVRAKGEEAMVTAEALDVGCIGGEGEGGGGVGDG